MKKFTLHLKMCLSLLMCIIFMAFSWTSVVEEPAEYIQQFLTGHYNDISQSSGVKHYELNVTNSGFCRYKRFFISGKIEYFSFNLAKFKDLDYYGTDKSGELFLRTKGDDVIVQTYNERNGGDVDSMATYMVIPVKNIQAEDLNDLSERLVKMNAQLLAQK